MLDRLAFPIIQAPMAGGPSTPALAAAVSAGGGLGFLAAGLTTADRLREDLDAVRAATDAPFGVNLFLPSPEPGDPAAIAAYAERIRPLAEAAGVELGAGEWDDDGYPEKLEVLFEPGRLPAVVSFVFGCPDAEVVERLQAAGAEVWVTVTQVDEAEQAIAAGADGLVAQGAEAGGHRGGFTDDDREPVPVHELVAQVAAVRPADVELIGAGAVMSGAHVADLIAAGADAAQLGTAFLLTPEAGTGETHRAAVGAPGPTGLTRAFSGRRARGIVNAWQSGPGEGAPSAYPALVRLTAPLRAHGAKTGDRDLMNLWAGERHHEAVAEPVAAILAELVAELDAVGGP